VACDLTLREAGTRGHVTAPLDEAPATPSSQSLWMQGQELKDRLSGFLEAKILKKMTSFLQVIQIDSLSMLFKS
jgi:hypothetical protein